MSMFTCISCRVAFADAELQRNHYKTDWHRYNLKRKVAELPPLTAENFRQKVLAQKSQVEEANKETSSRCQICKKKFNSENAYKTHIKSKKHQEAEKNYNPDEDKYLQNKTKTTTSEKTTHQDEASASTSGEAKGDNLKKRSTSSNKVEDDVDMLDTDGEDGDASDAESWNSDEGEAIPVEECLFCTNISSDLEENVKHMTVNHSFFIPDADYLIDLEGLILYLGEKVGIANMCLWCNTRGKSFYSKQSAKNHMVDKGHSKMLHEGETLFEYADFYDYRRSYPDHENRTGDEEDMEVDRTTPDLIGDGYELVLPSGVTIGHRSLARYYKQRLRATRAQPRAIMPGVLSQYRALGWTGATSAMIQRKKKDIQFVQRLRNKHNLQLGVKANSLFKNYKPQNPI